MYKLAIFDFDGTLVDSAPGIIEVMRTVILEFGLGLDTCNEWSALIGVPLIRQMEILFADRDESYRQAMADRYREIYDHKALQVCPPFPGVQDTLEKLEQASVIKAIASSKRRSLIDPVLDFHHLAKYFQIVVGSAEVANHKPHPEPVQHIMKRLDVMCGDVVVIGDSIYDLEMARNAGVAGIGVTTGIHTREELAAAEPLHIISHLPDALPLILNHPASC